MMKDISTPVPPDEFQAEMRKCLQKAALVNYTKVSKFVKIEGEFGEWTFSSFMKINMLSWLLELYNKSLDLKMSLVYSR